MTDIVNFAEDTDVISTYPKYLKFSWAKHFLQEAIHWSKRSHDIHTQCGCVLVSIDNTIVSAGYNGFIRGIDDSSLPRSRPEKYPYMIHAEANAIYNAVRQGKSTLDCTAYITAKPCVACLQSMWQSGINRIIFTDHSHPKMVSDQENIFKHLETLMFDGMSIIFIKKHLIQ